MDYTIIGGAVNLASRLEHEAPEGGILISYETYAHVRDEVRCEETGHIRVRGIGHPVATYRVVDLYQNLDEDARPLHADLPHLRLDADPESMSPEERERAAALFEEALKRLEPASAESPPRQAVSNTDAVWPRAPRRRAESA